MSRDFSPSQYLQNTSIAVVTAPPFTISAWFKPNGDTASRESIAGVFDGSSDTSYIVMAARTGRGGVLARNGLEDADTVNTFTVGEWSHMICFVRSNTDREVMLNGDSGNTGTNTNSSSNTGLDVTAIGMSRDNSPSHAFDGLIGEVGFWNAALTIEQGIRLSKGISSLRIQAGNLVGYYSLYGNASPEVDFSGSVVNLTVTGAVQADHAPVQPPFGFDLGWQGAFTEAASADVRRHIIPAYTRLSV